MSNIRNMLVVIFIFLWLLIAIFGMVKTSNGNVLNKVPFSDGTFGNGSHEVVEIDSP